MGSKAFYQSLETQLDEWLRTEILNLVEPMLIELAERSIFKVTVSLSAVPDQIRTKVDSDARKESKRGIVETIDLPQANYPASIYLTQVTNNSSLIPIVTLKDTERFHLLVERIREFFQRCLPDTLELCPEPMSLYLIGCQKLTGPLWKIHRDACEKRIHVLVSECDESFIWFSDEDGTQEICSLPFDSKTAYILSVNQFHTVNVNSYINQAPRVHLVADLRERNAQ